ncbi:MAG: response regulator transcription factor [Cyclobacteriaceae bacterium]|nr:response regulator transcription factor [Cyclobacteriaceae bacterium]
MTAQQEAREYKICLIDDHKLFRKGMAQLIGRIPGYKVCGEAGNGRDFIEMVQAGLTPDLVLLDVQMPVMNGEETASWLRQHAPSVRVLALTMHDDEMHIIRMIRAGARGYILKDAEPEDLRTALDTVVQGDFYHTPQVSRAMANTIGLPAEEPPALTRREREFIEHACTELTYKEIADVMNCSLRTVDGYREELFEKLAVRSRVGLVVYAIRHELVQLGGQGGTRPAQDR